MRRILTVIASIISPFIYAQQNPGDYNLTIEVIEVCGNGDNDQGSDEEYRWQFWSKGPKDADFSEIST